MTTQKICHFFFHFLSSSSHFLSLPAYSPMRLLLLRDFAYQILQICSWIFIALYFRSSGVVIVYERKVKLLYDDVNRLLYYEQLKGTGVQATKHIFMALINAYAASGQYQKAKEVVLDKGIPVKYLNEIKSSLVSALALHGQMSDALDIYNEMKQNGCSLEPKAIISLIERQHSKGKLNLLLQLLQELNDPYYWADGCCRLILYCIRNKALRPAVDLLKKLSDDFRDDDIATEVIFDEVFSQIADMESPNLKIGIGLLKAIKEDLKLYPSRKCLDFLLSACVKGKDLQKAHLVWKEYEITGLPYNILSYLRMYQAYLAAGDIEAATVFLSNIPKDDPHVRSVLHACRVTYGKPKEETKKKKKKKKKT